MSETHRAASREPSPLISPSRHGDSVARTEGRGSRRDLPGIRGAVEYSSRRLASCKKSISHPSPALVDRSPCCRLRGTGADSEHGASEHGTRRHPDPEPSAGVGRCAVTKRHLLEVLNARPRSDGGWHPSLIGGDEGSAISRRVGEGSIAALPKPEHLKERVSQRGFPCAGDPRGRVFSAVLVPSRCGMSIPVPAARLEPGQIPHRSPLSFKRYVLFKSLIFASI